MTEREKQASRSKYVRKSNELVQKARYKLSLPGQKILLYLISQIPFDATEFEPMEFLIPDFCAVCGIQPDGGNYKMLEDALSDLLTDSARVWITLDNGFRVPIMWIEKPRIDTRTGKLMVKLDDDMKPYLLDLKRNYTSYELIYTLHFKSKYSIRLYENVKSYQYHDDKPFKKSFAVEDIRSLLDADNYAEYRNLNQRVIKPAVREINDLTDRNVEIREIKEGRKVVSLELTISAKQGAELDAVRQQIGAKPRKRKPAAPQTPKRRPTAKKRVTGYGASAFRGSIPEPETPEEQLDRLRKMLGNM